MEDIIERLDDCSTVKQVREVVAAMRKDDPVLIAADTRSREYNKATAARCKAIQAAEDNAVHELCKRWKPGQKVYFGKQCHVDHFMTNATIRKGHRYDKGDWSFVWQYQPRNKILWLCKAKQSHAFQNVDKIAFSLSDVREFQIDRTELELRKQ